MRSRDRSTRAVRLVSTAILRMASKPAPCTLHVTTSTQHTDWHLQTHAEAKSGTFPQHITADCTCHVSEPSGGNDTQLQENEISWASSAKQVLPGQVVDHEHHFFHIHEIVRDSLCAYWYLMVPLYEVLTPGSAAGCCGAVLDLLVSSFLACDA